MLPSLTKLSHHASAIGDEASESAEELLDLVLWLNDDLVDTICSIEAKHVWRETSETDNSVPITANKRLEIFTKLCSRLVKSSDAIDMPDGMTDPEWRLTPPTKQLVYFETRNGVVPEWKEADGKLSIYEQPEDYASYVTLLDWITYEWMALPPDYQAFALANAAWKLLPSEAWLGFSKDLREVCGQDKECGVKHIDDQNPVLSERLMYDLLLDDMLDALPHNRALFRAWVHAAFREVTPDTWNEDWVTMAIFEFIPGLLASPRIPITKHDKLFVDNLRDILERAAAPEGAEHQRDKERFEKMMRESKIPIRRSKRHRL